METFNKEVWVDGDEGGVWEAGMGVVGMERIWGLIPRIWSKGKVATVSRFCSSLILRGRPPHERDELLGVALIEKLLLSRIFDIFWLVIVTLIQHYMPT